MAQVVIVSNRLPVSVSKVNGKLKFSASVGGLATGLSSLLKGKQNQWIGWPGLPSDELTEADERKIVKELARRSCVPVFLSQKQIDDFYSGYSNTVLWPLFHGMDFHADESSERARWWRAYREVNQQFVDTVTSVAEPGSYIWVHDYQLTLAPEMLRDSGAAANIGFFLHIPFPEPAKLAKLTEHKQIVRGILGADLAGFHTEGYSRNFLVSCSELNIAEVKENIVSANDHLVNVDNFPMGIDYKKYSNSAKSEKVKEQYGRYKKRYRGLKVIASVDRQDPSKGLPGRLKAYRKFLEFNPKFRGKVVFSLIAAPSRSDVPTYQRLARQLDKLVKEINEEFGTEKWQPVDYEGASQPFENVTALFQRADVAFIAPIKDGMNLAAKEYVASRRRGGVLILSQTAGAAEELTSALIVNPRRPETLVNALETALTAPRRELRWRLRTMQRELSENTVQNWSKSFMDALKKPIPTKLPRVKSLNKKLEQKLISDYESADSRLFLLDYDGTLAPLTENYMAAKPSKKLIETLKNLAADKQNQVVIVSGRSAKNLDDWLGKLPANLIAEHGAVVRKSDGQKWKKLAAANGGWQKTVRPILEKYARLTPYASVEVKANSLVWHYRAAPTYYAQKYSVVIKRVLKPLLKSNGLKLYQGSKILEVKDPKVNKGFAIREWLAAKPDFVLAIGDDFTDEDMFAALGKNAWSIKVGRGRTKAFYRVNKQSAVIKLLQKLAV